MTVKYVLLESCSIFVIAIVGINVVMGIKFNNKLIDLFSPILLVREDLIYFRQYPILFETIGEIVGLASCPPENNPQNDTAKISAICSV